MNKTLIAKELLKISKLLNSHAGLFNIDELEESIGAMNDYVSEIASDASNHLFTKEYHSDLLKLKNFLGSTVYDVKSCNDNVNKLLSIYSKNKY